MAYDMLGVWSTLLGSKVRTRRWLAFADGFFRVEGLSGPWVTQKNLVVGSLRCLDPQIWATVDHHQDGKSWKSSETTDQRLPSTMFEGYLFPAGAVRGEADNHEKTAALPAPSKNRSCPKICKWSTMINDQWWTIIPIWLVVWTPLKNISQLGWLFPIYGKIKMATKPPTSNDDLPIKKKTGLGAFPLPSYRLHDCHGLWSPVHTRSFASSPPKKSRF